MALPTHTFLTFTATGPMLLVTVFPEPDDPHVREKLRTHGIDHYLAYEVSPEIVEQMYSGSFSGLVADLGEVENVRVLDWSGHQIMASFSLEHLGEPVKVGR